jgi:hypothetical protein
MEHQDFTQIGSNNQTQQPFIYTEQHLRFLSSLEEWLDNEEEILSLIYDEDVNGIEDGEVEILDEAALAMLAEEGGFGQYVSFDLFN